MIRLQTAWLGVIARLLAATLLLAAVGCATVRAPSPADPFEGFNRSVDAFNQKLDSYLLRPVAKAYVDVVPSFMRQGVGNFFDNIADGITAINNLLQAKPKAAASDAARVLINSTIGVLGLFDVATDMGFERHDEDFGQTFGRWGAGPGPYLVLPLFGPSTVRDAAGIILNFQVDPVSNLENNTTRTALSGSRVIDRRADLLELSDSLEGMALDNYAFVRDAFLARRRSKVYDGNPPPEKFIDDESESRFEPPSIVEPTSVAAPDLPQPAAAGLLVDEATVRAQAPDGPVVPGAPE